MLLFWKFFKWSIWRRWNDVLFSLVFVLSKNFDFNSRFFMVKLTCIVMVVFILKCHSSCRDDEILLRTDGIPTKIYYCLTSTIELWSCFNTNFSSLKNNDLVTFFSKLFPKNDSIIKSHTKRLSILGQHSPRELFNFSLERWDTSF